MAETINKTIGERQSLTWLQKLIEPHPSIINMEARQRAQLVSAILLVLIVVGGLLLAYESIGSAGLLVEHDMLGAALAMPFGFIFYLMSRRGHINTAATGLIAITFLLFVFVPFSPNAADSFLGYAVVPLLLTGMLFSIRRLVQVSALMLASLTSMFILVPDTGSVLFNLTLTLILASAVIVTYSWYVRKMETIRRGELEVANEKLRLNEAHLEERVADRTRDLVVAAEVSKQVSRVVNMDDLLPNIVNLTKAGFGLYHVSVFLHDPEMERLRLAAGSGEVGQKMLNDGKQFRMTDVGIVPLAARTGHVQIMDDVQNSPDYFPNPLLPATRTEVALPMMVGNTLIGVLDLQAMRAGYFTEDDLRTFSSLAEQIAVAVRNAELFEQVQHARQEAEQANVVKSQFLAAMSHELRTPLNAILNFTQFVSSGMLGDINTDQTEMLDKVVHSGKHLLSLINDVLDISKIEAGALKLFVEDDVNLGTEIVTIIATAESMVAAKNVSIQVDIDPDLPLIIGDKRRLRQVMLNLVSNACKFTDEGLVRIELKQVDDQVRFAVHDTGPGIDEADHEAVFETFRQTQTGLRQGEGTGLGLPISRRLSEIHGGSLWYESEVGKGSSFYMQIPVRATALLEDVQQKEATHVA